jgi:hypothetical protein
MRFLIMHRTTPHWEAGARPTPELVARVGALIGDLQKAGVFRSGEGLRPSSEGVRVTFGAGALQVVQGPYAGDNELPAEFSVVRAPSIDAVVEWASEHAEAASAPEADIRPVTEPWDIGLGAKPADITTRRFMVLRKASPATEAGRAPSRLPRSAASDTAAPRRVEHLVTETLRPSARGRRYKNSEGGLAVVDGPFAESKELVGGYVILSAGSLDEVDPWARRYFDVVGTSEVDVRELA